MIRADAPHTGRMTTVTVEARRDGIPRIRRCGRPLDASERWIAIVTVMFAMAALVVATLMPPPMLLVAAACCAAGEVAVRVSPAAELREKPAEVLPLRTGTAVSSGR